MNTLRTNRNDIAWQEFIRLDFNPLRIAITLNGIRDNRHCSEFCQRSDPLRDININIRLQRRYSGIYLPNHSALEDYEHKQGEETVIPVFIQTP